MHGSAEAGEGSAPQSPSPPSSAKNHAASTLVRSQSLSASSPPAGLLRRHSPLTGNNRHSRSASLSVTASAVMDAFPDLAKCSREQLVEMVGRGRKDLQDATDKAEASEEREAALTKEHDALTKDWETAKTRIDELLNEEGRMYASAVSGQVRQLMQPAHQGGRARG